MHNAHVNKSRLMMMLLDCLFTLSMNWFVCFSLSWSAKESPLVYQAHPPHPGQPLGLPVPLHPLLHRPYPISPSLSSCKEEMMPFLGSSSSMDLACMLQILKTWEVRKYCMHFPPGSSWPTRPGTWTSLWWWTCSPVWR